MTIEEFIAARIAEDERAAREAIEIENPTEGFAYEYWWLRMRRRIETGSVYSSVHLPGTPSPKRLLLQAEFARELLTLAEAAKDAHEADMQNGTGDGGMYEYRMGQWHVYTPLLKRLAATWSDHPDYQTEWSPTS